MFVAVFPCLPTLKDFESECWEFESLRPHQKYQRFTTGKVGNQKLPLVAEKGKDKDKGKGKDNILDINMANQRKVAGIEIQNIGNKEGLIDLWENIFSESWRQDSKISEIYKNKLAEFEN